jgi:diketogulonate reductase-like aldo/keto reductase
LRRAFDLGMWLACLLAATRSATSDRPCEDWCVEPCSVLNGDVERECGGCSAPEYRCREGAPGFPGTAAAAAAATGYSPQVEEYEVYATGGAGRAAPGGGDGSVEFDESVVDGSCAPFMRTLGGATAGRGGGDDDGESEKAAAGTPLKICPVLNGIWTSFLDPAKWRSHTAPLSPAAAARIVAGMRWYDAAGLATWIGEDFDERVLTALAAHFHSHRTNATHTRPTTASSGSAAAAKPLAYSIIIEREHDIARGLGELEARLGKDALRWVQLGPPALRHLPTYAAARAAGRIGHVGVEDYSADMLEQMGRALPIATVQQEINLLVRPSGASLAFCEAHGCKFVAYGPLLGGLLSDRYLGLPPPTTPDADHSKQTDYLDSIRAWGDWRRFQALLRTLRAVGDAHGRAPVAVVALAYVLQLRYMLAAIVGVRLGGVLGADHRRDSLQALALKLAPHEVEAIEQAVAAGAMLDGLART